jgi:hypothetical protein
MGTANKSPILMWGSQGEGEGQFSGLNDVIYTANLSMCQIIKIIEYRCLLRMGIS